MRFRPFVYGNHRIIFVQPKQTWLSRLGCIQHYGLDASDIDINGGTRMRRWSSQHTCPLIIHSMDAPGITAFPVRAFYLNAMKSYN